MAVTEEMVIDAVDRNDTPIGVISRAEVFVRRANFRVAHDLIFNSRGELLVQKLSSARSRHPGFWGSSVAAYLFAGESYQQAAERRLAEELDIHGVSLNYIGKTSMEDEGSRKFIAIFAATYDGQVSFDERVIDSVEFLPIQVIREQAAAGSRSFTPTFLKVLDFYQNRSSELLPS